MGVCFFENGSLFFRKWELVFSKMGVCFFEDRSLFYENGSLFSRKWEFVFSKMGVCFFVRDLRCDLLISVCKMGLTLAYTTPTVRGIFSFAVFFSVSRPFCRFTLDLKGTLYCVVRRNYSR